MNFEEWNEEMYKKHGNASRMTSANPLIKYFTMKRINAIVKFSRIKEVPVDGNVKLLDLGCGGGMFLKTYFRKIPGEPFLGFSATGVDLSSLALAEAKKNLIAYKEFITLEKGNAQTFRNNKKYDFIVCTEVLEHVEKPEEVIDTIAAHAENGTTIIISVPNESLVNFIKRTAMGLLGPVLDDWHIHTFSLNRLLEMVPEEYKLKKIKRIPSLFLPLTYVCKFEYEEKNGNSDSDATF